MKPRHRHEPAKTGSAAKRAVVTSVVSSLALASVTITAAAVTLTGSPAPLQAPVAAAPETTFSTPPIQADADEPPAPPAQVRDLPVGIPDIALVVADTPQLDAVPDAALAAYQRAAAVLDSADKKCNLSWALVAAVGQVVSGHGSTDGGELGKKGVVRPELTGKALRGRDGKRVPDSDAGRLDGDERYDRAVGPMQLSPATWAVVGVDSDGDGKRNPHDIDDAALAVAVLLCSGDDDLRRRADRVHAVRRVNDGRSFVETVLDVARAYRVQMKQAYNTVPVVVPNIPVPSDLPIDARQTVPADDPADGPTTPTNPSTDPPSTPTPTEPEPTVPTVPTEPTVPTVPTAPVPPATHPPRDPSDSLPEPCPTVPEEPLEPVATEPPDGGTDSPTTDEPVPTEPPADEPIEPPRCSSGTEGTEPAGE